MSKDSRTLIIFSKNIDYEYYTYYQFIITLPIYISFNLEVQEINTILIVVI